MRIAYFDCFSGAAGDMILAALLDAGCPEEALRAGLATLRLDDARLEIQKVRKGGFAATQVSVRTTEPPGHRHLKQVRAILEGATLPRSAHTRAVRIFERLAEAEARAHGMSVDGVHFHEVGAADAIIDIAGACLALELLGVERVECSPIPTGSGTVTCAHGIIPIPAPGTAALLEGVPIAASDEPGELTTPTGAAVLTTLAAAYGPLPAMRLERTGYGAGLREHRGAPNLLRVMIGESAVGAEAEADEVVLLEANIDDATGELLGYAMEALLAAGALDAFLTPIQMKKGRPGVMLSVLAAAPEASRLERMIFSETTTFGVRRSMRRRTKLRRRMEQVQTPYGMIAVKVGLTGDAVVIASPEYEACARAAREHGAPLRAVLDAARRAWAERHNVTRP